MLNLDAVLIFGDGSDEQRVIMPRCVIEPDDVGNPRIRIDFPHVTVKRPSGTWLSDRRAEPWENARIEINGEYVGTWPHSPIWPGDILTITPKETP